jgi:hypothetical protein
VKAEAVAAARHGSPQDSDDHHHHQTDEQLHFLDRQRALEAAMSDVNGSFGKGIVTRLGSAGGALVETFPSGCLALDYALGGGLPKGHIVEVCSYLVPW